MRETALISRQEAIDELIAMREHIDARMSIVGHTAYDMAIEALRQPEIIRCKDCKHKHIENMVWTCPFGLPGGENFFCGYGAEPYKEEQE